MWKPGGRGDVKTVIGPGTEVKGQVRSSGSLRIDGRLEGGISCEGDIIIGDEGEVVADITAENVVVSGKVMGNIRARGKVEILGKGYVKGDITALSLVVTNGVFFEGRCLMTQKAEEESGVDKDPAV